MNTSVGDADGVGESKSRSKAMIMALADLVSPLDSINYILSEFALKCPIAEIIQHNTYVRDTCWCATRTLLSLRDLDINGTLASSPP